VHVYIATPAAGGVLSCLYVNSLLHTMKAFRELGWKTEPHFVPSGWTALARNELAGHFEHESQADVLMFVDADIGWTAHEASALVDHATECGIIGAHYPKKELDWTAACGDPEELRNAVSRGEWPHRTWGESVHGKKTFGFSRVETDMLPGGFMAISRDALAELKAKSPGHLAYLDERKEEGKILQRFEYFFYGKDERGRITGEDVTFSNMVRAAGMKLYKMLGTELQHEGKVIF
jgi:hypothetical protein